MYAQLHLNIYNEIGVKLDNKNWFDHVLYQNQSKEVMKVRLSHYGVDTCEMTELFLAIN